MRLHANAFLAVLLLAGCAPKFDGPEKVKGLRVLAVRAEPPEIGAAGDDAQADPAWPPSFTAIQTLVGHPQFAGDPAIGAPVRAVVAHVACTPDPANPVGTVCTEMSALSNPAAIIGRMKPVDATEAAALCDGKATGEKDTISFTGLEACTRSGCGALTLANPADSTSTVALPTPRYALPDGLITGAVTDPADPRLVLGTDVVDVSLTFESDGSDLVPTDAASWDCPTVLQKALQRLARVPQDVPHVLSLKWIHVRGPTMPKDSAPNLNPAVDGIQLRQQKLPALADPPYSIPAAQALELEPAATFAPQTYDRYDTDGKLVDRPTEDWSYSWFATAGDIKERHTSESLHEKNTYTLAEGKAMLWLVVRDLRGGESWTAAEVEAAATPAP